MKESELNLFGIPIYIGKIKLKKEEINYIINSNYERVHINNGFKTKNNYLLNDKNLKNLKKEIENELKNFVYNQLKIKNNYKFVMLNSWAMKHIKNDWAQPHYHSNSFISGVVYLKTNKNSGYFSFNKNSNWNNICSNFLKFEYTKYTEQNCDTWFILPENGNIILFPSFLEHSVSKNESDEDRYCCSFNFYPNVEIKDREFDNINLLVK
jgi:uncharacterized protein (TIGR02466 family)